MHTALQQVALGHHVTDGGTGLGQLKYQFSIELWALLLHFRLSQGAGRRWVDRDVH